MSKNKSSCDILIGHLDIPKYRGVNLVTSKRSSLLPILYNHVFQRRDKPSTTSISSNSDSFSLQLTQFKPLNPTQSLDFSSILYLFRIENTKEG
ncbi:hypothetical protein L1887_07886 [Cichorium endivia]|nr:hypothetical protein L1887_07886 [Cichorium endivia]